jgi:tRNA U34 5-methylaminomethyl-2-thiouridine-forming methyltransferase MnmC
MENEALKITIVESADGSHTLHVPSLKEHYHSHKGALQESYYVFLKMGLDLFAATSQVKVLEVGFGTGLNALLTFFAAKPDQEILYTTLESFPLSFELVKSLNYPLLINEPEAPNVYENLHLAEWQRWQVMKEGFKLMKVHTKLQDFLAVEQYDLIYYDAFAPHAQPELWELPIFIKLYGLLSENGILVTYCAKGQVRRDLQKAGFKVERLPGPPGKREMLRARKENAI